jgi:hypothetical protein
VDWFPWGEEAFEKAKKEDKIILLSIGYATCHWCHVMERESFENETTAKLMNENFVCIKLDREERPDIDKIYMDALHAMQQQGGWPLNMFLTPEKKPIAGGTYFPPVAKYGRKSFNEVLEIIKNIWKEKREELIQSSESIANYLKEDASHRETDLPNSDCFEIAFQQFDKYFDETFYGFKTNMVNKFPPSMGLSYLLSYYNSTKQDRALFMVEKTLQAMKKGGIYDQIGGGISRYATDQRWLVPHFEKMLYDNSLFLIALAECFSITRNEFYKTSYYDIVNYIRRDMTLEVGGIASAEDADSEGEEGKFYIWSLEEFRKICGEDSSILEKFWNVTEEGNFEGHTILNEDFHIDFIQENQLDAKEFATKVNQAKQKLLEVRSKRIRPLKDDKILSSWNSLYVRALAIGASVFQDSSLFDDANRIHSFLNEKLTDSSNRILRRFREGESKFKGYLTDYSERILSSLYLYFYSLDKKFIIQAKKYLEDTIHLFKSEFGPFYDTGNDAEELICRTIDAYDGVEPSGNSSISYAMNLLSSMGIEESKLETYATEIFKYFSEELSSKAISFPFMLKSYSYFHSKPKQIVLTGKKENPEFKKTLEYLQTKYNHNFILVHHDGEKESEALIPILKNKYTEDFSIFICENQTCSLPIKTLEELKKVFD